MYAVPPEELAAGGVAQRLGHRVVDWLKETLSLLRGAALSSDVLWDNLQVRGGGMRKGLLLQLENVQAHSWLHYAHGLKFPPCVAG